MLDNILKEIESMSAEDKQNLLATEFPAELEKEAEAELNMETLADAVYTFGYLSAERTIAEADGIDKVAAENLEAHNSAVAEAESTIETLVETLGLAKIEDEAELHKQAQGIAGIMFEGWSDCMDKVAAGKGAMKSIHKAIHGVKHSLGKHKKGAVKMLKRHGKGAAGGAAAGAAAGYFGKKHMDKRASELTAAELITDLAEAVEMNRVEASERDSVIDAGVEKLAKHGLDKAMAFGKKHLGKAVAGAKKHGPGALVGAAAGAAGGAAAAHHNK